MLSLVLSQLYAAFGFGIGSAVANVVRPFFLLALATPNYLYLPGKEQGRKKLASAAFANIGSPHWTLLATFWYQPQSCPQFSKRSVTRDSKIAQRKLESDLARA